MMRRTSNSVRRAVCRAALPPAPPLEIPFSRDLQGGAAPCTPLEIPFSRDLQGGAAPCTPAGGTCRPSRPPRMGARSERYGLW
jgi:hypothetical protein